MAWDRARRARLGQRDASDRPRRVIGAGFCETGSVLREETIIAGSNGAGLCESDATRSREDYNGAESVWIVGRRDRHGGRRA